MVAKCHRTRFLSGVFLLSGIVKTAYVLNFDVHDGVREKESSKKTHYFAIA